MLLVFRFRVLISQWSEVSHENDRFDFTNVDGFRLFA